MKYYIRIDGVQRGPFDLEQLPEEGVRPSTYVWCEGMADWEKAEDVADICRLFRNHLYDVMHPAYKTEDKEENISRQKEGSPLKEQSLPLDQRTAAPTRFGRILNKMDQPELPTIEEIDSRENTGHQPVSMIGYAWIVTLFCFPPTGIVALICAYKSKNAWLTGAAKEAHDYCRGAKMWTGISFFMGLIVYAFIIRFI